MPSRPPNARADRQPTAAKAYERNRGTAASRGYDNAWRIASRDHRRSNPLCLYCKTGAFGPPLTTAAELTDHLYPHRGDADLFWARQWWVSACAPCHSGPKQAAEAKGDAELHSLARHLGRPTKG